MKKFKKIILSCFFVLVVPYGFPEDMPQNYIDYHRRRLEMELRVPKIDLNLFELIKINETNFITGKLKTNLSLVVYIDKVTNRYVFESNSLREFIKISVITNVVNSNIIEVSLYSEGCGYGYGKFLLQFNRPNFKLLDVDKEYFDGPHFRSIVYYSRKKGFVEKELTISTQTSSNIQQTKKVSILQIK